MTSNEFVQVNLHVKILELLYQEYFKSQLAGLSVQALSIHTGNSENEVYTALEILAASWLTQRNKHGWFEITWNGINQYEEWLPPSEITKKREERKRILEALLPLYQKDPHNWIPHDLLMDLTQMTNLLYMLPTVKYMSQSGIVDLYPLNGGAFYVKLNGAGLISLQDNITDNMAAMSNAYKILFNLENHLRQYIESKMRNHFGAEWWEKGVSGGIRQNAEQLKQNDAMLHDRTVFLGSLMMIQAILLNQL